MRYDPVNKMLVEDNKIEVKDSALSDIYSDLKKNYPEINIQVSSFKRNGKASKSFSLTNISEDKLDRVKKLVTYNIKKHNAKLLGSLSVTSSSIGGIFVEDYTKDSKTFDSLASDIYKKIKISYPGAIIKVSDFIDKTKTYKLTGFEISNIPGEKLENVSKLVKYLVSSYPKQYKARIVSVSKNEHKGTILFNISIDNLSGNTKDSKTKDLEKPYFDPLYKDTRRAVVKEVQNYLSSKGYNNSVGKYDKVVYGVRSLLEKTLLQPGTDKFNDAVHKEADRLLKKYNLTKDNASEFNRLVDSVNSLNNELGSDWLKLNGKAVHPDYAKREVLSIKRSIPSKVNSNELTEDEAKKLGNLINQVLKRIDETKRKYTGYDSKTVDAFNKVDMNSIFGQTDKRWLAIKRDIRKNIANTKDLSFLAKLYNRGLMYENYSEVIDDYLNISNEVNKYAIARRNEVLKELDDLRSEVTERAKDLKKEQK